MILAAAPVQINSDWPSLFMKMGWVDAVFLFVFVLGVFLGIRKGFAKILPGFFAVVIAQIAAVEYSLPLAAFLQPRFQVSLQVLEAIFFAILAIGIIFLIHFLFQFLSLLVSVEFRPPLNNIGAAIFGGLQFLLFLSLIVSFLSYFQIPFMNQSLMERSISGPYLAPASAQVHDFFIQWFPVSWRAVK